MKPRISVITLGVADLETSLVFYRDGLGLPTEGIVGREFEHGAVAFFDLPKAGIVASLPPVLSGGASKTTVGPMVRFGRAIPDHPRTRNCGRA